MDGTLDGQNQCSVEKGAHYKIGTQRNAWNAMFVFVMAVVYLILPACSFSLGCLNTPAQHIKDFFNSTDLERKGEPMSSYYVETYFGLLTALTGLGAAVGCLLGGYVMDAIGRKYGVVVSSLTTIVGSLIMAFSKESTSYEMLFVGRVITGIATGLASTIAPAYVVETCVPEAKPTVALICQLIQSFAIMCANVVGFDELLGTSQLWPYLLGLPATMCILQLLLLPFCPESPRFLLMKKGNPEDAKKAFQILRGKQDVMDDIKELHREQEESNLQPQVSLLKIFTTPSLRRPLVIAFVVGWYISFSGVDGILLFSTQLFREAGMEDRIAKYTTSGTGLLFFGGNLASSFLLPRFKHKTIFHIGTSGTGLCCVVVAFTMMYKEEAAFLKYVNVVTSLAMIALFSIGPACLFWVILAEIFPHSARGAGLGIGVQSAYLSFFAHNYIFPQMLRVLQKNSFFVFAGINVCMIIFVHYVVPETKHNASNESRNSSESKDADIITAL